MLKNLPSAPDPCEGERMQIPPMPAFDIDALEPVTIETTLRLPSVSTKDVRAATQSFSSALAHVGGCDAHREPDLLVELLMRSLLMVSHELLVKPVEVLSPFDHSRFRPWFERRCEVLVPSARGAAENQQELVEFLSSWRADLAVRETLKTSAVLIAVGSLSTIGRLPIQEAPEPSQMD